MISININSGTPIYEQIIEGFKEHILLGRLKPGDLLPSVRRLAADVGINPNTVSKAYLEMERLGMITTRRGKGAYVAEASALRDTEAQALGAELRKLVAKMRSRGMSDGQIGELWRAALQVEED